MCPKIKVLFMSGYSEEAILRQDLLVPGAAFLPKPFAVDSFQRKVREILDAPK